MLNTLFCLAMAMGPQGGDGKEGGNPIVAFMPLILMFVIFYFLLIRPQQKKQKAHKEMLNQLKKNDRVVTSGGILGTVIAVKDSSAVLLMEDGETKIEVLKSAVSQIRLSEQT